MNVFLITHYVQAHLHLADLQQAKSYLKRALLLRQPQRDKREKELAGKQLLTSKIYLTVGVSSGDVNHSRPGP